MRQEEWAELAANTFHSCSSSEDGVQVKVLNVVDVSYGGENGFSQAIELSAEILSNVKFIQVRRRETKVDRGTDRNHQLAGGMGQAVG